jgi:hypothetical protein
VITRVIALVSVLLVGLAAPARAWCEASCLAPAHTGSAKPHCPTHEPASSGTSLSATVLNDCPVVESARPTITARLDVQAIAVTPIAFPAHTRLTLASSFVRPHGVTTVFERSTPLRI